MASLNGFVIAEKAQRYVIQLAKHWAHRFQVSEDGGQHIVDFGDGSGVTMAVDGDRADFSISGPADALVQLREIFEDHLNRFAHREGALVFHWSVPSTE